MNKIKAVIKKFVNVKYVNKIKKGFNGKFYGFPYPRILILQKNKDDIGLLVHEFIHFLQFKKLFWLHCFLYSFSKKYRLACEIEAYAYQILFSETSENLIEISAEFISKKYNLNISKEEAAVLLKNKIGALNEAIK